MTDKEAMKLALDALENQIANVYDTESNAYKKCLPAITALKERLAQPEQEPVAILNHAHGVHTFRNVSLKGLPDGEYLVYTFPPQRTEPVIDKSAAKRIATVLGWTPPRTWVGLTDEEFWELDKEDLSLRQFVQAIEAKLKEKNA